MARVGVVLLKLVAGANWKVSAAFLYNLFSDPRIIRLGRYQPLQQASGLADQQPCAAQVTGGLRSIGGGLSPATHTTEQQGVANSRANLRIATSQAYHFTCMRYWHPFHGVCCADLRLMG